MATDDGLPYAVRHVADTKDVGFSTAPKRNWQTGNMVPMIGLAALETHADSARMDSAMPEQRRQQHPADGHRRRLRDKFLTAGLSGFHDYEVLELLLTLGTPRKDCKPAAKAALQRFGDLASVFEASRRQLCEIDGIGPKNLFGIKLIPAVCERYLEKRIAAGTVLHHSRALFDYLYQSMRDKKREQFKVLFLDAKNRVLGIRTLFEGTLTASSVYPREVVRAALDHHAAALIFAHNHPSGDPQPSPEDTALTRRLITACRTVDLTVHEHIIIGGGTYFSYADSGKMAEMVAAAAAMDHPS